MKITDLSKDDLIAVIAEMHDTIQYWDVGYGLTENTSNVLLNVGVASTNYCIKNNSWELPDVEELEL